MDWHSIEETYHAYFLASQQDLEREFDRFLQWLIRRFGRASARRRNQRWKKTKCCLNFPQYLHEALFGYSGRYIENLEYTFNAEHRRNRFDPWLYDSFTGHGPWIFGLGFGIAPWFATRFIPDFPSHMA
jgi:hypothetical protein